MAYAVKSRKIIKHCALIISFKRTYVRMVSSEAKLVVCGRTLMCFLTMKNCLLITICSWSHFHFASCALSRRKYASHNRMLNKTIFSLFPNVFTNNCNDDVCRSMCSSIFQFMASDGVEKLNAIMQSRALGIIQNNRTFRFNPIMIPGDVNRWHSEACNKRFFLPPTFQNFFLCCGKKSCFGFGSTMTSTDEKRQARTKALKRLLKSIAIRRWRSHVVNAHWQLQRAFNFFSLVLVLFKCILIFTFLFFRKPEELEMWRKWRSFRRACVTGLSNERRKSFPLVFFTLADRKSLDSKRVSAKV